MTRGCHGIYFLTIAKRSMALLDIDHCGIALNSNVQVGNNFLMDVFIGKAPSTKSVRAVVQYYDTELPLDIAVMESRMVRSVYVANITITDETVVIA